MLYFGNVFVEFKSNTINKKKPHRQLGEISLIIKLLNKFFYDKYFAINVSADMPTQI